ncbi:MAG: TOBE domain-containing protein [Campylobacterota bacterium]|nr:TOBE domain-containing protein [Campylobacterota bacterium]
MSNIIATVSSINRCDNLNIVKLYFNEQVLSMMSLELQDNIKVGVKVKLSVKPTHVAIGKNVSGLLSYSNQLICTITSIDNGKLLSSIKLKVDEDTTLESIITVNSSSKMDLKVDDNIVAYIKASEISINEVIND